MGLPGANGREGRVRRLGVPPVGAGTGPRTGHTVWLRSRTVTRATAGAEACPGRASKSGRDRRWKRERPLCGRGPEGSQRVDRHGRQVGRAGGPWRASRASLWADGVQPLS